MRNVYCASSHHRLLRAGCGDLVFIGKLPQIKHDFFLKIQPRCLNLRRPSARHGINLMIHRSKGSTAAINMVSSMTMSSMSFLPSYQPFCPYSEVQPITQGQVRESAVTPLLARTGKLSSATFSCRRGFRPWSSGGRRITRPVCHDLEYVACRLLPFMLSKIDQNLVSLAHLERRDQ